MQIETLRGKVSRVFFANPESPFMAGVLATDDGEVRFAGKVAAETGDKLEITGQWGKHPRFGKQFEAESGLVKMDESPEALAHLLASDKRFSGLGPARARKVVDAALLVSEGGELGDALRDHPQAIADRSGVKLDIVERAGQVWNEKRSYFDALATLAEQGWSNAQAQSIVSVFGENAATVVRADPYTLIGRVPRFGFRTVDAVARKMGVAATNPYRLGAGLVYCMEKVGQDGHTWTTRDALLSRAMQELEPDTLDAEARIESQLEEIIAAGILHVDRSPFGSEIIADAQVARAEFELFGLLLAGLKHRVGGIDFDGPRAQAVFPTLNGGQRAAVEAFGLFRFGVLSGGAGVGKTYTMRAVCEIAEENGLRVALCAPSGKAARKLEHSTGRKATTIHRLLEPKFNEKTGRFDFTKGPKNPIDADLVIVDEVSMSDVRLMLALVRALESPIEDHEGSLSGTRLLMVGDHNQIPSVSAGAVLRDLLAGRSKLPGSVHILVEVVRQAGILARNTSAILDGVVERKESPEWGIVRTERGHEEGTPAIVATIVEELVTDTKPVFGRQLDLAWDVQVLAPMRKGPVGTYALNVALQKLRQRLLGNAIPPPTEDNKPPKPLLGDRIIWTENDYELDLLNGTQAVVVGLPKGGAMHIFTEDGREVEVPAGKRKNVEVAYAMTLHKAQGSEWPAVVLCASMTHNIMHDRNLLYTGASRSAQSLTIVGDAAGIERFARQIRSSKRDTFGAFLVQGWTPTNPQVGTPNG